MNIEKQYRGREASLGVSEVDRLINKGEAAEILRVSTRTLDRLVSAGDITRRQVSKRRVCFRLGEILAHAGITQTPTPASP